MRLPRRSGLLLHPTSLPGRFACGDLGSESHAFVEFLAAAGQSLWQVLPLGPTGFGDSPYQSFSAFAGNPLLVSAERLADDGLLSRHDLDLLPARRHAGCDFGRAVAGAARIAERIAERLPAHPLASEFEEFCARTPWLADYALFMALREAHDGQEWNTWSPSVRDRDPGALAEARRAQRGRVRVHEVMQWAFARQWQALRAHAHARGIVLLGDAPIFVAFDSADVWAAPELFQLDRAGRPTVVAGVPPDYFSATGQLWGNPLYRWDAHAADDYAWWRARLAAVTASVDLVRLDHFIGFVRYWAVPPGSADARPGSWQPGPGAELFHALERALGGLPLVAEDLGETGADVEALRDGLALPGMRVLQFAFGGDDRNPFLPRHHVPNCVVYTGTHDNDTTCGWWATREERERRFVRDVIGSGSGTGPGLDSGDIAWDLMAAGAASVADTFIAPVQDVLSLGSEARLNTPGLASGNWTWRLGEGALGPAHGARLHALAAAHGRDPAPR